MIDFVLRFQFTFLANISCDSHVATMQNIAIIRANVTPCFYHQSLLIDHIIYQISQLSDSGVFTKHTKVEVYISSQHFRRFSCHHDAEYSHNTCDKNIYSIVNVYNPVFFRETLLINHITITFKYPSFQT